MTGIARTLFVLSGALLLASRFAAANAVSFEGYLFSSLYGPENLMLSSGNLLVPTTSSDYGGAITSLPSQAATVTASFLDSGFTTGPAAELWVQDFTNPLSYEAAVGAFTGLADYYVLYRVDGVSSAFLDTHIARTPGTHTASIEELADGTVDFFLDNALAGSASAAQFGIPILGDTVLTANGDAALEQATFTAFSVTTPEPSSFLLMAGVLAMFVYSQVRTSKRNRRSSPNH